MCKIDNYTILHLHSDISNGVTNIDSVTKFYEYIERIKELDMKSIAFTEHGSVFSWKKKMDVCKENDIKYIHGIEMYVTEDLNNKVRDNYHCCMYAKNTDGFHEINKLISKARNRKDGHFYFVPRITFDELTNISDNIIITTACLGGILGKGNEELKLKFIDYMIEHKDRCYLELQHHLVNDQYKLNKYLIDLHNKYNIPLTIGTDTHALNSEHLEGRKVLQKSKKIFFDEEDGWDLSLKTYDELIDIYKHHEYMSQDILFEALDNTNKIADCIEEYYINCDEKYPKLYDNAEDIFKQKILKGIETRKLKNKPNFKEYIDRINEEFKVYKSLNTIDYMLLETTILEDANKNGIQYGYGRGSVNGSIIAYLLGITECDSVKFKLNFFRFMNPDRKSMPDIDVDFCRKDREWVKEYLYNMHGLYCADIITFNTIALKGAIRDVCRALYTGEVPKDLMERYNQESDHYGKPTDATAKKVTQYRDGKYLEISNYICENIEDKEEEMREEYPDVFKYVDIINGTIVSVGTHPSGTIVSPIPLDESMGLCSLSTTDNPVSMLQMKEVDSLKFVKLDILGLDNIGVINETCKDLGIKRLTPDNINFDDDDVYESILEDTTTIFQMESDMAKNYLRHILSQDTFNKIKERYPNITKFDLLKFTNGAIRPSGESFRDKAMNGICGNNGLKEIDEMLYDSLGYCLVQEQIMMFLVKFCGFSMAESDLVRRAIAKKYGTEQYIEDIKTRFIKYTYENYNLPNEEAEQIIIPFIDVIISAQRYGFSDNHNFPYSTTSYVSAYLRYHHPLEYLTECFNMWSDDADKTTRITNYTQKRGISINSPKFRYSKAEYMPDKQTNTIYKGIASIKFLNENVANELYSLKDNTYNTFLDLLKDIATQSINSRQLDILIKIGFFSEFGKTKKLLDIVECYNKLNNKKQFKKDKLPLNLTCDIIRLYATKETDKTFTGVDTNKLIQDIVLNIPNKDIKIGDIIDCELENLGYVSHIDETYSNKVVVITEVKANKWGTPFITMYRLCDGKVSTIKVDKNYFNNKPLSKYDLISIADILVKPKKRKDENGKWQVLEEKELILTSYSIVREDEADE